MSQDGVVVLILAALNGARSAADGPAVPLSPAALAEAAALAVAAGAGEVRVRPRTPCGRESLSPRVLGPLLAEVRAAVGVPVGVDAYAGGDRVREWTELPEVAAVDWALPGAEELAGLLLARGVGVEAVVRTGSAGAGRFLGSPLRGRVLRVAVAVSGGDPAGAPGAARVVVDRLAAGVPGLRVLAYGVDAAAWPVLRWAAGRGLDVRAGVADTGYLPDGRRAASNAQLVAAAAAVRDGVTAGSP
ncbi:3-keto-5-aminohexanoate cleavage protein [Streptomyces sp. NPDC101118]|uniref:3-keto-5-aminohexanoate cleavage protein n=1 Tax=Streptomyces sp. NPDC101118 TaxID=3366109 RepID=UPI0037F1245C